MTPRRSAAVLGLVVGWLAAALLLDSAVPGGGATRGQQHLLGVGTWLLLLGLLRRETLHVRVQVGVVVVFATVVEYVFSEWLGTYEYRLGTVPVFVPPGHGLVYLAALSFARLPWAQRHGRALVAAVLVVGGAWALWGLTLSPTHDALGAFWYGCLVLFAWRGRSPLVYVGAFLVVSYLEIAGTSLGTWRWGEVDPVLGWITIGNPPSGIAGGYAWFDAAALAAAPWITRRLTRHDGRRDAPDPAEEVAHSRAPVR